MTMKKGYTDWFCREAEIFQFMFCCNQPNHPPTTPGKTRTCNLSIRSRTRCPIAPQEQKVLKCLTTLELSRSLFYGYVMVAHWRELALAPNGTPPINVTNITV
jgi:hypothetical protein